MYKTKKRITAQTQKKLQNIIGMVGLKNYLCPTFTTLEDTGYLK